MGILDKINGGFRAAKDFLFGTKPSADGETDAMLLNVDVAGDPTYRRTTTATRRFHRDTNREYNHISMPVQELDAMIAQHHGYDWWRNLWRSGARGGTTYNVGINAEKRRLKALGLSKRELKFALRTFRTQLRAQGIK